MVRVLQKNSPSSNHLGLYKQRFYVIPVVLVVLGVGMASGVQRAALALYAKDFSGEQIVAGSYLQIALSLAGFGLMKAIGDILSGDFSDRHGRKVMIVVGACIYLLGSAIIVFFRYFEALAIGNALIGAGEGFVLAAAVALLLDAGGPKERATSVGLFEFSVYFGYSFGSAAAGIIIASTKTGQDFQTPFFFSAAVALLAVLLAFTTVRDTRHLVMPFQPSENEQIEILAEGKEPSNIYANPSLLASYLNGHIGKIADALMVLIVPILLIEVYGLAPLEMGMVVTSFTLMWAIMMPLVGHVSDRFGRKNPVIFGLLVEATGLLGFVLLPQTLPYLIATSGVAGAGCGLYYPVLSSIAVDIAQEEEKAKVVGFYRGIRDLGLMTGPLIVGLLASVIYTFSDPNNSEEAVLKQSLQMPFFLVAGFLCVGALIIAIFVKETRPYWTQYEIVLRHARVVCETIETSNRGIQAYLAEDSEIIIKGFAISAKLKERHADQLEEEIAVLTYASARGAHDSLEFLKLARRLDRAGGLMMGVISRLRKIPVDLIPRRIKRRIGRASTKVLKLTEMTIAAMESLNLDIRYTPQLLLDPEVVERKLDALYRSMSRELFKKADSIPIGTVLQLKEVIDMIEMAADSLEDACHMIRILSFMHLG
ncbi:MAG: MFS transporter, partial [Candidatus Hodarchaeales archaeon]|jgi:MFS family permease